MCYINTNHNKWYGFVNNREGRFKPRIITSKRGMFHNDRRINSMGHDNPKYVYPMMCLHITNT